MSTDLTPADAFRAPAIDEDIVFHVLNNMSPTSKAQQCAMEQTLQDRRDRGEFILGRRVLPEQDVPQEADPVNHPPHYTSHPSGVECIQVVEHMGFNLGNAIKYIWRADEKGAALEDLRKARWYIDRELQRREAAGA